MAGCSCKASPVFSGLMDRFNGVTVSSWEEPCSREVFAEKLAASLEKWTEAKVRGVWFKVALPQSEWVPLLAQNGFGFHHAKPEHLTMCKWLPQDEANNIPPYAHTMVGVGAMVVDSSDQVLVVQENYHAEKHWKLPGGYVEPGEDLAEASVREVMEETGIKAEFESLLAFRHSKCGYNFGCADFYFIACLRPLSTEIKKCEQEIARCRWMPLDEFLAHPKVIKMNKMFAQKFLEYRKKGLALLSVEVLHPITKQKNKVYSVSVLQSEQLDST